MSARSYQMGSIPTPPLVLIPPTEGTVRSNPRAERNDLRIQIDASNAEGYMRHPLVRCICWCCHVFRKHALVYVFKEITQVSASGAVGDVAIAPNLVTVIACSLKQMLLEPLDCLLVLSFI